MREISEDWSRSDIQHGRIKSMIETFLESMIHGNHDNTNWNHGKHIAQNHHWWTGDIYKNWMESCASAIHVNGVVGPGRASVVIGALYIA